jgi:hypothetical protein
VSKAVEHVSVIIAISLVLGIAYFLNGLWKSVEQTAYHSCILSIASKIEMLEKSESFLPQNKDWTILNEEQMESLMSKIGRGDCKRFPDQTLDLWNNKIHIASRKPGAKIDVIVWSNGEDNVSGTEDDLIVPDGHPLPK